MISWTPQPSLASCFTRTPLTFHRKKILLQHHLHLHLFILSHPKNHCYRGFWMCIEGSPDISKPPVTWDPMILSGSPILPLFHNRFSRFSNFLAIVFILALPTKKTRTKKNIAEFLWGLVYKPLCWRKNVNSAWLMHGPHDRMERAQELSAKNRGNPLEGEIPPRLRLSTKHIEKWWIYHFACILRSNRQSRNSSTTWLHLRVMNRFPLPS